MTHAEFLLEELATAETNHYEAKAKGATDLANYWTGYANAINNALHNLNGMGE